MTKATQTQVIKALIASEGAVAPAAKALGMTRQALHGRINTTPKLVAAVAEIDAAISVSDEATTREARNVVKSAIAEGDGATAKWWLEKRDPAFRPSANLKLDPETVRAMMAAATPDALRKMAAG